MAHPFDESIRFLLQRTFGLDAFSVGEATAPDLLRFGAEFRKAIGEGAKVLCVHVAP